MAVVPFEFDLSQVVVICISHEWGEVKARAQYADGENQYLIHYQAADGRATTEWFGESMLEAAEDAHDDDKRGWSHNGELVITGIVDGKPEFSRIEVNNGNIRLTRV
ncbi:TPA: hypothetical protein JZG45_003868 [Escherichia coli]|nr:hypothetical protein [Escherichia coli]